MIPLGLSFAFFLVVGVPIAFAMGLAGSIGLFTQHLRPEIVPDKMFVALDGFILLAAPFYILAGELMGRSGITQRLVRLSLLVTGRFSGGSAYATVLASILFSGISGTAVGDGRRRS